MYNQYDPEILRKLQLVEADILKEFDRVCTKNNLTYFLTGGSAIGAVRHQGFVPWDDDIDVGLLRDDFEKLIKIAPKEFTGKIGFENARTHPEFPFMNSNATMKGTVHIPMEFKNCKYTYSIGMGVFPYDNMPEDLNLQKKQIKKTWFWGKLYVLRNLPHPHLPIGGFVGKLATIACTIIHYSMAVFHISRPWILKNYNNACMLYNGTTDLYTDFTDTTSDNPMKLALRKSDIFPIKRMPFENIEANMVNKYHEMLTRTFGDYMQLPPEDDRKNHFPFKLTF